MVLTEYERGLRDIREWLQHSPAKYIDWKIGICQQNYPDNPRRQPYYDAMLAELRKAKAEAEKK